MGLGRVFGLWTTTATALVVLFIYSFMLHKTEEKSCLVKEENGRTRTKC